MQQITTINHAELASWLALWRVPGIGPVKFYKLLENFPDLQQLFKAVSASLSQYGLSAESIKGLAHPDWAGVERDLCWTEQANCAIITSNDPRYPKLLQEIPSAPPLIYVRGDPMLLNMPQLAMVGSRNPTVAGIATAKDFAAHLTRSGFTITSGLALGIDAVCHQSALGVGGNTIAVVGTGLDQIYPARHKQLAQEIVNKGAIVSELPIGTGVRAQNFPRRNRLISGLSCGVLVVEAAIGSGSLITARYALEHGREIFAIPGSIHNPLARGCHALIRQGAKLVESANDIIEELRGSIQFYQAEHAVVEAIASDSLASLDDEYIVLLKALDYTATSLDLLVERTQLTAQTLSSMLLILELKGYIAAVPGGYQRI